MNKLKSGRQVENLALKPFLDNGFVKWAFTTQ